MEEYKTKTITTQKSKGLRKSFNQKVHAISEGVQNSEEEIQTEGTQTDKKQKISLNNNIHLLK